MEEAKSVGEGVSEPELSRFPATISRHLITSLLPLLPHPRPPPQQESLPVVRLHLPPLTLSSPVLSHRHQRILKMFPLYKSSLSGSHPRAAPGTTNTGPLAEEGAGNRNKHPTPWDERRGVHAAPQKLWKQENRVSSPFSIFRGASPGPQSIQS